MFGLLGIFFASNIVAIAHVAHINMIDMRSALVVSFLVIPKSNLTAICLDMGEL